MKTTPLLQDERGTILIIELAVLGIVLVASCFAYYNYSQHKKAINRAATPVPRKVVSSPTATPSPSAVGTVPSKIENCPATSFLVIAQWGVKLPVCGVISDIKYKVVNGNIWFYSPDLYPKYPGCGTDPNQTGIGALTRLAANTSQSSDYVVNIGVIGSYRYYFDEAQQPCVQPSSAPIHDQQLNQDINNQLISEAKQLSASQ